MRTTSIWLAAQSFMPVRGGGTLRLYRYFPGLRTRGARVSVLTGTPKATKIMPFDRDSDWYHLVPGTPFAKTELLDGTPFWGIRLPDEQGAERDAIYYEWLIREFGEAQKRPELLAFALLLNRKTERWLRRVTHLDVPTVYLFTLTNKLPSNPLFAWRKRRSLGRQYESFDCIIVASEDHEKWLRELGVKTRIEVVPNGVDAERFRPAQNVAKKNTLREKHGFDPEQKIVLNIGAVTPRKGTALAIEAWTRLARTRPEYQLIVLGNRTDERDPNLESFAKHIEKLVLDPAVRGRIHMRGMVDDVEAYYRIADALIFPTEREGMPNTLLEAMASGLPAVVTSFRGLNEDFGTPGTHYLLSDRNPESLAAALEQALSKSVGEPIARRARSWVVERMALAKSLDRYAEIFHELAHLKD